MNRTGRLLVFVVSFAAASTFGVSEARAAGDCREGFEQQGLLCYPVCKPNHKGVLTHCWERCPEGYADDGLTCRRNAHIYTNCFTVPKQGCPPGYSRFICTCTKHAHIFGKKSYFRGLGEPLQSVKKTFENVTGKVKDFFDDAMKKLRDGANDLVKKLVGVSIDDVVEVFKRLGRCVLEKGKVEVVERIRAFFANPAEYLKKELAVVWVAVKTPVETLLRNPGEGLNRILDIATGTTITDAQIDKFLEFFERWVGTTIDAAGSKTLTCLSSAFQPIVQGVRPTARWVIRKAVDGLTKLWTETIEPRVVKLAAPLVDKFLGWLTGDAALATEVKTIVRDAFSVTSGERSAALTTKLRALIDDLKGGRVAKAAAAQRWQALRATILQKKSDFGVGTTVKIVTAVAKLAAKKFIGWAVPQVVDWVERVALSSAAMGAVQYVSGALCGLIPEVGGFICGVFKRVLRVVYDVVVGKLAKEGVAKGLSLLAEKVFDKVGELVGEKLKVVVTGATRGNPPAEVAAGAVSRLVDYLSKLVVKLTGGADGDGENAKALADNILDLGDQLFGAGGK